MSQNFEKSHLKSKKFVAFLLCVIILGVLAGIALVTKQASWPLAAFMLSIVLTIGFLGTGYVFSTAQLDKYVRLAQITGKNPLNGNEESEGEEE